MYTVGARESRLDAFETPAVVQTLDGQYLTAQPASSGAVLRPVALRSVEQRRTAPAQRRTVYRTAQPERETVVVEREREDVQPKRSWGKTALIIGGGAASGAGVGAMVDGKKGALIGAAIGGGAASIYEATRRR
jgi:hypothetical protein